MSVSKQTDPEWSDFSARIELLSSQVPPAVVGIVVRDASGKGSPVIGRCFVRAQATLTEGWYPLTSENGSSCAAEVYVCVEWPEFCKLPRWHRSVVSPSAPMDALDDADEAEIRSVSDEPGRFFRCGELVVTVKTLDTPPTTREPRLNISLHDQRLRGYTVNRDGECVDFGAFAFALMQGAFPDKINIVLSDRASKLPLPLSTVAEQTLQLPTSIPGFNPQPASDTDAEGMYYVLQYMATSAGSKKVTFDVRLVRFMPSDVILERRSALRLQLSNRVY
jgi:hypothetical protein